MREKDLWIREAMNHTLALIGLLLAASGLHADELPAQVAAAFKQHCAGCHHGLSAEGDLDLTSLAFDLEDPAVLNRWILIHDRIEKGEMPPEPEDLPDSQRASLVRALRSPITAADRAQIAANGRGPMRRLNRVEFEQNLRDVLKLPHLDTRDRLPRDRESHHCDKVATALDMSRVQLAAYIDAAEAALRQAMVRSDKPPSLLRSKRCARLEPGSGRVGPRAGGSRCFTCATGKALISTTTSRKSKTTLTGHDFSYTIASTVDAGGQLTDGRRFDDIHDLKALLLIDSRQLARNLLHQFTNYATGTPVRFGDRDEIEVIRDRCAKDDYRVRELMLELICSPAFHGGDHRL